MQLVSRAARFARGERGAVVVEFALAVPVLLLVIFALVDLGRAYLVVGTLESAVRDGARRAAVLADPAASADSVRAVVEKVNPLLGRTPITDAEIVVSVNQSTHLVTVQVQNYPFSFVTPFSRVVQNGQLTLTREATAWWESGAT